MGDWAVSEKLQTGFAFPETGREWDEVLSDLEAFKSDDFDWRRGRLPTYTYFWNEELLAKQKSSYTAYLGENGLGEGSAFKSIARMSSDIYSAARSIFHAPDDATASFTSGGSESLFLAVKTCRDWTRSKRKEPKGQYNIVAGESAHPALLKAAKIMDVEVRRVPVDAEYRVSAEALRAEIDDRTMMLFASAPCYPYGVFDRIEDISALALSLDLWFHVDGCWGGFISPFAKLLGYPIPEWDLAVPGVTSLSADLHKFGYAAKGASLLLYRDPSMMEHQAYYFDDWPRGIYYTPTLSGSKAAGSVSSAWAMLQHLGLKGYIEATDATMAATMQLIAGIDQIDGLETLPQYRESNLFSFVSTDDAVDIMAVADILQENGWMRGRMKTPLAVHQGVTASHLPYVAEYLEVVSDAVDEARRTGRKGKFGVRSY
ncbi:MAG: aspartate aminotransferase family protein [Sphingomonadales bacterium]|nr:MAG: aspartate aminotransferase family protein [Sphingomonadales bacterium]